MLHARRPAGHDNVNEGRIVDATYTAGSLRYRVQLASDVVITQRTPSVRGVEMFAEGDRVFASWRAEDTLLVADD